MYIPEYFHVLYIHIEKYHTMQLGIKDLENISLIDKNQVMDPL